MGCWYQPLTMAQCFSEMDNGRYTQGRKVLLAQHMYGLRPAFRCWLRVTRYPQCSSLSQVCLQVYSGYQHTWRSPVFRVYGHDSESISTAVCRAGQGKKGEIGRREREATFLHAFILRQHSARSRWSKEQSVPNRYMMIGSPCQNWVHQGMHILCLQ